ncbi:MAG: 3-hydroxyacyl-ACP dehydratase FabZ [Alphaproteobacteria bacterium GM7ARS4]|nr:3-hydroxyacyl-ACP dehydratase FabZ [Alphaproteobacteria bacterium GM7ARS4]
MTLEDIQRLIPHRYPFLMVEKLVDIVPYESATGIKNVSVNEPHFTGHFPTKPIMPGVLILESLAQTAGVLVMHSLDAYDAMKFVYFMSVDKVRFRHPVLPGDTLHLKVQKLFNRRNVWRFHGKAFIQGRDILAAEAVYTAMISDD